jgi:hypothetical protein
MRTHSTGRKYGQEKKDATTSLIKVLPNVVLGNFIEGNEKKWFYYTYTGTVRACLHYLYLQEKNYY